jgi:large subunit ribosomal protein L18
MNRLAKILNRSQMRAKRVRSTVSGTPERPRLSISISNRHISAQIIDDTKHTTLAAITTVGNKDAKGTMSDKAEWVGTEIAKKAVTKKIKKIAFDRNGRLYHGRVQKLADAARKSGLEF